MRPEWRRNYLIVYAAFFVCVIGGGYGVPSISYPPAVQVVEVIGILAIIAAPILIAVRWLWAPAVALIGSAGGFVVAIWDARVPGQHGPFELVVLGVLSCIWLAALACTRAVTDTSPSAGSSFFDSNAGFRPPGSSARFTGLRRPQGAMPLCEGAPARSANRAGRHANGRRMTLRSEPRRRQILVVQQQPSVRVFRHELNLVCRQRAVKQPDASSPHQRDAQPQRFDLLPSRFDDATRIRDVPPSPFDAIPAQRVPHWPG
jgi:hypothetical protein